MPDTPQPTPSYSNDDASLPTSESGDPQDATILSRSATLRRMVQRFQHDTLSAALDIDRSQSTDKFLSSESPLSVAPLPEGSSIDNLRQVVIAPSPRPEPKVLDSQSLANRPESTMTGPNDDAPWTLQQFFNGDIDLDAELAKRFPTMPMMSMVKFRTLGSHSGRRVATLSSQDGSASLTFDGDISTKVIQMSFTLGSMLTLRFSMNELSELDRTRWLELMKREEGGLAFLWGQTRWSNDYVICIARKYFTNFYAFSPHNFEAAVRLTPGVIKQLLEWLEDIWSSGPPANESPPTLLTW